MSLKLPPEPHMPGRNARPAETLFEPIKTGLSPNLTPTELATSPAFKAGFEAFERGYFWEAHELWEAVWINLAPASPERHLLQALIQLANAGLKRQMGHERAAAKIDKLAQAAIFEAFLQGHTKLMGIERSDIELINSRVDR